MRGLAALAGEATGTLGALNRPGRFQGRAPPDKLDAAVRAAGLSRPLSICMRLVGPAAAATASTI